MSAVLGKAEERKKHQEEGSQDEVVPEEAAAEHDEGVDGLLLLQFVVQEATDRRKERECQEEKGKICYQVLISYMEGLVVEEVWLSWVIDVF